MEKPKGQFAIGVSHGMGSLVYEDVIYEEGQILNPSFLEYKVHGVMEAPNTEPIFIENPDPSGPWPYGAKEVGSGVILSPAPAIVNAIYHATGVMIKEFPTTPERILNALEERNP